MPTTNLEIVTDYGTATIGPDSCAVRADGYELYSWAHRSGAAWPCSTLEDLDSISAGFDTNGLVDLEQSPEGLPSDWAPDDPWPNGAVEIDGSELSAWTSDVLRETLPGGHPCWLVCVGQFIGRDEWPESAVKVWGS